MLPVNIRDKISKFDDHWSPKVIAEMNDYQFKLAKLKGDFVWHKHEETDETFFIIEGELLIEFRDGNVSLKKNDLFVVPKGKEHKPFAAKECVVLLIEPKNVINTGNILNKLTAKNDIWI